MCPGGHRPSPSSGAPAAAESHSHPAGHPPSRLPHPHCCWCREGQRPRRDCWMIKRQRRTVTGRPPKKGVKAAGYCCGINLYATIRGQLRGHSLPRWAQSQAIIRTEKWVVLSRMASWVVLSRMASRCSGDSSMMAPQSMLMRLIEAPPAPLVRARLRCSSTLFRRPSSRLRRRSWPSLRMEDSASWTCRGSDGRGVGSGLGTGIRHPA